MTSIFVGQPPQNKAFSNQNKGHLCCRYIDIPILDILGINATNWYIATPTLSNPGFKISNSVPTENIDIQVVYFSANYLTTLPTSTKWFTTIGSGAMNQAANMHIANDLRQSCRRSPVGVASSLGRLEDDRYSYTP